MGRWARTASGRALPRAGGLLSGGRDREWARRQSRREWLMLSLVVVLACFTLSLYYLAYVINTGTTILRPDLPQAEGDGVVIVSTFRSTHGTRDASEVSADDATSEGAGVGGVGGDQTHFLQAVQEAFQLGAVNSGCSPGVSPKDLRRAGKMRVFFAADLHNNDALMAHWLAEFLRLVLQLPRDKVFVSVYDSASRDTTPTWVGLLTSLLVVEEVPHVVVSDPGDGRRQGQHRIEFLAHVRNKAIAPLGVLRGFEHNLPSSLNDTDADAPLLIDPEQAFDKVVFLNDVYFCARDIVRLLLHDVDMSCGMDYDLNIAGRSRLTGTPQFYDTWVARDMTGKPLKKVPPHFHDPADVDNFKQGRPVQVQCCWNGMTVMNALPFHRGLRFRHARGDKECKSSECSHACDDFWHNGFGRIVVDPLVKLAYTFGDWRSTMFYAEPEGMNSSDVGIPHADLRGVEPVRPQTVECCSLSDNSNDKLMTCSKLDFATMLKASPCLCSSKDALCECSQSTQDK